MRRKALQDVANTLCQMVVGWRMNDDFAALATLPDGVITFDVLEGTAVHDTTGPVELGIASELASWCRERLAALDVPVEAIAGATLAAALRTAHLEKRRERVVTFDWTCRAVIETDEKSYVGTLTERHVWHDRRSAGSS